MIKEVIQYSQNIENPIIDPSWKSAKDSLSRTFLKGQLSYTYPHKVQFELDKTAKEERLRSFINYARNLLNNKHPLILFLEHLTSEEFFNNTLSVKYELPVKVIPRGAKVLKSFKYFIKDPSLLQNKASELIQENKVEGYLTFSVHPLDFLSSSENTYHWRSCHSLDGEHRAGNLSYMYDSSTMIVYLSTGTKAELPHFPPSVPWNSKKWRMLLHFDRDLNVCFAGRQYPFFSKGALKTVKEVFSTQLAPLQENWNNSQERERWDGFYNDYLDFYSREGETLSLEENRYCVINNGVFDLRQMVKDTPGAKHFNDILNSSYYTKPYYMFKHFYAPQNEISFSIGSEVLCAKCGERPINGLDSMMCSECECTYGDSDCSDYYYCDNCGRGFYRPDGEYVGDDFICHDCVIAHTFECANCHDRAFDSEACWDNNLQSYICARCAEEE